MTVFLLLKALHIGCALLSVGGFALRAYWLLTSNPLLQHRITKRVPHTVDTALLASAIGMLVVWQVSPLQVPWLLAKIIALLIYIALGMIALRFGTTGAARLTAAGCAMLTALYIIAVAFTKSPLGPLALI